jgi:hypothetical protein
MQLNMAKKMTKIKVTKRAVTVVELVIVATLSCVIMGVGMAMMSRSNTQFKKSNDLISIQRLMDNIIERIRSDVRSLKRVVPSDDSNSNNGNIDTIDNNKISFVVIKMSEDGDEVDDVDGMFNFSKITYEFNPDEKTLYRYETTDCDEYGNTNGKDSDTKSDFHGARQVISMNFEPIFNSDFDEFGDKIDNPEKAGDDFKCLNVAMQIASNEYNSDDSNASTLSIACQFYSTCVESELRISKLRESN